MTFYDTPRVCIQEVSDLNWLVFIGQAGNVKVSYSAGIAIKCSVVAVLSHKSNGTEEQWLGEK